MKVFGMLRAVLKYLVLPVLLVTMLGLLWLRWESHQPRDDWFVERHGALSAIALDRGTTRHGQLTEKVTLGSDSGLNVLVRTIRDAQVNDRLPVLLVLGGHRTGSDAVNLFGRVSDIAVVGMDYPYDGPQKVRGVTQSLAALPSARLAFLDTVSAVSLVLDWLVEQSWVDTERIVIVGASLGVPFAATAGARDERIGGAMLVHGAADNRAWLEAQVARRIDTKIFHYPLSVVLHWLAYGPVLDTAEHVATIAPRPVLVIGARNDERTPAGQTEMLYDAAGDPKRLRYTDGAHIEPDRTEIIAALLRIASEEMEFLTELPK